MHKAKFEAFCWKVLSRASSEIENNSKNAESRWIFFWFSKVSQSLQHEFRFKKLSMSNIWQKPIHYSTVCRYIKPGFGFQATLPPLFSTYMPWIANDVSYYKEMSKRRYRIQVCILKYKKQCISSMLGLH